MWSRHLLSQNCTAICESPRFQILHMVYFVQNVQKYRRYKEFEIYVEISTGTTISQEMLKQTVNKNNIHVPVGVSQVSQLVVMILLINDCYVMSLVVIISRMNFVLYRNKNVSIFIFYQRKTWKTLIFREKVHSNARIMLCFYLTKMLKKCKLSIMSKGPMGDLCGCGSSTDF